MKIPSLIVLTLLVAGCHPSPPVVALAQAGAKAVCACADLDCATQAMNRRADRLVAAAPRSLSAKETDAVRGANQQMQGCLRRLVR